MDHDRIHARAPPVEPDGWRTGTIRAIGERDGHCVVTVDPNDGDGDGTVELTVTFAIRDLFVSRLDAGDPVGQQVWFKRRGR